MSLAINTELALYRSGLLRKDSNARHVTAACKAISRHLARIARHNITACKGIDFWNARLQILDTRGLSDDELALADRQIKESREAIRLELAPFLVRGARWDWKDDPRCGYVLRINDKDNRRDVWLG